MIYSPDKFGFYQIGNYKTYSKLEAMEYGVRNNITQGHWNFNDEVFSKIDTTKEPQTSLSDLYKMRCMQIRNAYDYVVLFYSGGSDSHNILMHWLESGCKLDEVAIIHRNSGTKDENSFSDAEAYRVAIPHAQKLQETHKFKLRIIDQSKIIVDYINEERENLIYYSSTNLSPNNGAISHFRKKIDEWKSIISSGKKLCFVWGKEKPYFHSLNCNIMVFHDSVDNVVNSMIQNEYHNGWYDELFYSSPDLPELPIKQAHVVRNFISNPIASKPFNWKYNIGNYNIVKSPTSRLSLTDRMVATIIYPYWNPDTFTTGKSSTGNIFSKRDSWIWNGNLDEKNIFTNYANEYLKKRTSVNFSQKQYSLIL